MGVHLSRWTGLSKEHRVFGLVLFLGLINALVFVYAVPPWQHYDEPTQFEYAWLIANEPGRPQAGEYNQSMRREVAASMLEHGFFREMDFRPNLLSSNEPIWIGISQLGSAPAYYWLAALPLRLLRFTDVALQLIAARHVSLFLFLVTVLAAYGISTELTPPGHPLRWLLPISIVLLPGFVDVMTALNDDVGATAIFSLYLWAGVRLIHRGFSWARFILFLLLTALCLLTKNTVMIALALAVIPLVFSLVRSSRLRAVWLIAGASLVLLVFSMFLWGDAAFWHRLTALDLPSRENSTQAPLGDHAFRIRISSQSPDPGLIQLVPYSRLKNLGERHISLGAWIWASKPTVVRTPILLVDQKTFSKEIQVGTEPIFHSFSIKLSPKISQMMVKLAPGPKDGEDNTTVFYDGIVLAEGRRPKSESPNFNSASASQGEWGKQEFTNLIRNASAETAWPRLKSWADRLADGYFPGRPSLVFSLLLDPRAAKEYYRETLRALTRTFWASFGWGNVTLRGIHPYLLLGLITLIGLVGTVIALWQRRRQVSWPIAFFLGLALLFVWGSAFLRGSVTILQTSQFIPVARYAYPVIVPTMLTLILGWMMIGHLLSKSLRISPKFILIVIPLLLALLNAFSVYSILRYYGG